MSLNIVESILTKNPCYTAGRTITVKGLMLHSVGCAQPSASVFIKNWNSASHTSSCVHGFIDGNDGTVYQTLPWNHRGWHCGSGSNGSGNNTHIGVEMCEPACIKYTSGANFTCSDTATAKAVAKRTYESAVELFAYLCQKYGLDPTADGVIISHKEGHSRGIASNHGDPEHLWNGLGMGYTMDTFRKAVKAAMNGSTTTTSTTTSTTDDGSMTDAEMYAYFKSQGLNDYGVAGLMGNLYAESGLAANNLQNTGNTKLGMTDAQYTAAVDGGTYTNFVKDGYGYGLAQWTYYSRKQALLDFMTAAGVSIGHKKKQCEFLVKELVGYTSVLNTLKNAKSVLEASNAVLTGFERPADQEESVQKKRAEYGQMYYDKYSGSSSGTSSTISASSLPTVPFSVKVLISDLNYRSEGSMNGKVLGQTGKGTFTITKVNSDGWGRLKSGAGWIYLLNPSYCTVGSSTGSSSVPYQVKVSISDLNIRKGPGTNYSKIGKYTGKGVFTIVEEASGTGSTKGWGLLKSYQSGRNGWISLEYCEKV